MTGCVCGDPRCAIPNGTCHCGCGQITNLARFTNRQKAIVGGVTFNRFVCGHAKVQKGFPRTYIEADKTFKIQGVYCRLIPLTKGYYTIVDDSDYKTLTQWSWHARSTKRHPTLIYADRWDIERQIYIPMHRQILELDPGNPLTGDHIDPWTTLDNRRKNLRAVTMKVQLQNRKINRAINDYPALSLL